MFDLLKNHPLVRSILHFFTSLNIPLPPPLSEEALRTQHREQKHRDEQRQDALYAPIIFSCPNGHPYVTDHTSILPFRCLICVPLQSPQNEQQPSQEIQGQLDYWHQKRDTQSLLNRKMNEAAYADCGTGELQRMPRTRLQPLIEMRRDAQPCDAFLVTGPNPEFEETVIRPALRVVMNPT